MEILLPKTSIVVLCGPAGCGKSTFAKKNFRNYEIVSSDSCRAMVCDDESNMESSKEAFELFYFIIEKRMKLGKIIAADSTALSYDSRRKILQLAGRNGYYTVLVMFDIPLEAVLKQNNTRDRKVPEKVIKKQYESFIKSKKYIDKEGFDRIVTISPENIDSIKLHVKPSNIEVGDSGPFDIISDIHGCCSELEILLDKLGYKKSGGAYTRSGGRKVIFAGDIVDRGPRVIDTINTVYNMVLQGSAYYIPGNHCNKFYRYLQGRKVQVKHGLEMTVEEYEKLNKYEKEKLKSHFIDLYEGAPPYIIADFGNLVIAHAGIREDMIGKTSGKINDFVLYGDVTGKTDTEGFPERGDWTKDYCGEALIVYGHTPVDEPVFVNNTINIDQGVSIGGSLTALRYPEKEIVQVKSLYTYYTEGRRRSSIREHIDLGEFSGPIMLETEYKEKNRFTEGEVKNCIDILKSSSSILPWIVYAPAVIPSTCSGSFEEQLRCAVKYYKDRNMRKIAVQQSLGDNSYVAIICSSEDVSLSYFLCKSPGMIYNLYSQDSIAEKDRYYIANKLQHDLLASGYFSRYNTDFVIFQCSVVMNDTGYEVFPMKLISHSCSHFLDKDNLWQLENISRFCENSNILEEPASAVIETAGDLNSYISKADDENIQNVIVKPVKVYSRYSEILVTDRSDIVEEECLSFFAACYNLSKIGIESFVKNKLSKDYFKYIIGCVACSNRILKREALI